MFVCLSHVDRLLGICWGICSRKERVHVKGDVTKGWFLLIKRLCAELEACDFFFCGKSWCGCQGKNQCKASGFVCLLFELGLIFSDDQIMGTHQCLNLHRFIFELEDPSFIPCSFLSLFKRDSKALTRLTSAHVHVEITRQAWSIFYGLVLYCRQKLKVNTWCSHQCKQSSGTAHTENVLVNFFLWFKTWYMCTCTVLFILTDPNVKCVNLLRILI